MHKKGEYVFYDAKFFESQKHCKVAEYKGYYAHGETLERAKAKVEKKFWGINKEKAIEILMKCVKEDSICGMQWHELTQDCTNGIREFFRNKGLDEDLNKSYTIKEAIELSQGWGRHDKFVELVNELNK